MCKIGHSIHTSRYTCRITQENKKLELITLQSSLGIWFSWSHVTTWDVHLKILPTFLETLIVCWCKWKMTLSWKNTDTPMVRFCSTSYSSSPISLALPQYLAPSPCCSLLSKGDIPSILTSTMSMVQSKFKLLVTYTPK